MREGDVAVYVCAGYPPSPYWQPKERAAWAVFRSPSIDALVSPYQMAGNTPFADIYYMPRDVLADYAVTASALHQEQIKRVLRV